MRGHLHPGWQAPLAALLSPLSGPASDQRGGSRSGFRALGQPSLAGGRAWLNQTPNKCPKDEEGSSQPQGAPPGRLKDSPDRLSRGSLYQVVLKK